jgi:hypothetical protein
MSTTRCTKLQQAKRFGEYGIVVRTSTRMEDVPAASTFTVEDTLLVHQVEDGEGKVGVQVEISYGIVFFQGSIFKYIIESSTNREMKIWMDQYYEHMQKACANVSLPMPSPRSKGRKKLSPNTKSRKASREGASSASASARASAVSEDMTAGAASSSSAAPVITPTKSPSKESNSAGMSSNPLMMMVGQCDTKTVVWLGIAVFLFFVYISRTMIGQSTALTHASSQVADLSAQMKALLDHHQSLQHKFETATRRIEELEKKTKDVLQSGS